MEEPLNTIVLVLALLVMSVGLIGTVVPVIPGTILIFLAALVYALVEGFQAVGWPTLLVLGLLALVATTADLWVSSIKGGGTNFSLTLPFYEHEAHGEGRLRHLGEAASG